MAKNPHLTQDKLNLLAQIPDDVIELISSGVKTQSDLAAMIHGLKKVLYLAIQNISKRWTMPIRDWAMAYQQMLIKFGKI